MALTCSIVPSPIGNLMVIVDEHERVRMLAVADRAQWIRKLGATHLGDEEIKDGELPASLRDRLTNYFAGDSTHLKASQLICAAPPSR
jgi:hypothetical protein